MVDLKGAYFSIEDKWYSLIDKASDKLPFIGSTVDWIEEKKIPSFPLAILLVILLFLLIYFLIIGTSQALIIGVYENDSPLLSASVSVYYNGEIVDTRETNTIGNAVFYLDDKEYTIKIDKSGYGTITKDFIKPTGKEQKFNILKEDALLTKAITLKKANGELITGTGFVTYTCVSTNQQKTGSYSNGIFTADFSNCPEIRVDNVLGYNIVHGTASFSGTNNVVIEPIEINTGTITVPINSEENLEGLRVNAKSEDGLVIQTKIVNAGTSTIVFEEMPVKKYYITTHSPTGNFLDYDGSLLGELKDLRKNETITFNITLQKSNSSTITVNIKDIENGLPINGVEVKLSNTQNQVDTQITGATGQIIFNVPQGTNYTIAVEHPQYLIGQTKKANSGEIVNFDLVKANENNSQSLLVSIVDSKKEPISNVKITLKKLDDTVIGEKTTGADGLIEFYNLDLASYYVYAIKENFRGVTSSAIQIMPRRQTQLEVILDIGQGNFELEVLDESLAPIMNATIKAINFFTKEIEEEKFTDALGKTNFDIRADKRIYFVIESTDYLNYNTIATYPSAGATNTQQILMVKESGKLSAKILGVYLADSEIGTERIISQGIYNVKAVLEVPKGNFSQAGLHIRTGNATEQTINLLEEDSIKIGKTDSSANVNLKGTTYYPNNGYSIDSKNITNGTAKWIEAKWDNIKSGIYEIEFELLIEDAPVNSGLNLWYRGWAKGATTLRDPQNFNQGHEFYSSAKNYLLTSGTTSLCKNNFCISNEIKTLTGTNAGRTQIISNKYNAIQNNDYELTTRIVSRKNMSGVVLELEESGISIEKIIINGIERTDPINLGNLSMDAYTEIKILFKTITSGTNEIKIKLNSTIQNELDQVIIINVPSNKKILLDLIPKQIIPYINNTMFFELKDGNIPLRDALIEIKSNTTILTTIKTTSDGIAQYELSAPKIGDTITITARKEGYDEFILEKKVDDKLLLITPPQINNTIKIGEIVSIEETILLENATTQKVKIERVATTGELETFFNISFNEDLKGKEIPSEGDANYSVKIRPNALAQKLKEPKTIEGSIIINTSIEGTTQIFENSIPVRIRLSMPGYIDSDKCLKISPGTIEFNTSTNESTQTIEIMNSCTAEGIQVNLQEIEAKLSDISKLGTISISGNGFTNATLNNTFTKVNNFFEKNAKEVLTVRFNPNSNVSSGTQKIDIIFKAKNIIEADVSEEIEAKTSANISMSNLSKCIEIKEPAGGLILEVAGWNLGQNRIMTSNLSANFQNSQQNYQGFRNPMGMGSMPYGMNTMLPFMGAEQGPAQYEQNSFIITNNCAVDVEIDLDTDSRLNVSEEKFTISSNSDNSIIVSSGYTLGKYNVSVNAKVQGTEESKNKIGTVKVTVRKLGEIDKDCIKVNVNKLTFNSFLYKAEKYKVFNYCYDTGVMLSRTNTVSLKCDAPNATTNQDIRYLQPGQEQFYAGQYPSVNQNYSQYFMPQGSECGGNACAFITGTRTFDQQIIESTNGTIEEITFEVMPSAQYIPQRRLFDSKTSSYGLFSNLADIRQWATETDARTGAYGTLNVSYNNQYGSQQCMTFPVTIEDNYRLLESVDSAINWGDPNARPEECVGEQEKKALDLITYWKGRSNSIGNIPDVEFGQNGVYKHISEPPAVKVGPMPSNGMSGLPQYQMQYQQQYPLQQQYQQQAVKGMNLSNAKNCGLMDSISNLKYDSEFGGVKINVSTSKTGSILNNTLGPNLWVEIDRSGIQHQCVYIKTNVIGTLTRAINFQKGEVRWPLSVIVTRPGFVPPQGFNAERDCYVAGIGEVDCERIIREIAGTGKKASEIMEQLSKNYPQCALKYTPGQIDNILAQVSEQGTCIENAEEYGINLIEKTSAKELELNELTNYCENNFCNNEMLKLFLMEKTVKIRNELEANFSGQQGVLLSEIYKLAPKIDLNICKENNITKINVYSGINQQPINNVFDFSKYLQGNDKQIIIEAKEGILPIAQMRDVLLQIKNDKSIDFEELFLTYTTTGKINYISAEEYLNINTIVSSDSEIESVTTCGTTYTKKEIEIIARGSPKVIQLIKSKRDLQNDLLRKDLIYQKNDNLKKINLLTQFDDKYSSSGKSLYLTAENNVLPIYQKQLFDKIGTQFDKIQNFTYNITGLNGVGKYALTIDGDTAQIVGTNANISIRVNDKNIVKKSANNIILLKGFNLEEIENSSTKNSKNIIIDSEGFYKRTPIVLTASLHALEKELIYKITNNTTDATLINWRYNNGIINDTKTTGGFKVSPGITTNAKELIGLYYYPNNGRIIFKTENNDGATITSKTIIFNEGKTQTITTRGNDALLEITLNQMPTLEQIIQQLKLKTACVSDNGNSIIWNESELLKSQVKPVPINTPNENQPNTEKPNTQETPKAR
ncbi:MAG: SpaA isopeptide-forming pilin-related protein [Candidatus ainarchaeum sp.]|nr:SpaA isopeptide-forming pilin-related protein [Candidatus ainarchaeum sp.]